ncbi:N-acetylmuramoyl-L-alanine amidase [Psychromarinibacter halotolerans]|uniref:N-acetylmuramoyl-L-alanine amidase n=1 Tax=Psychromarinibacter halotolerans TaxID=1775175 RepID=A0ABV7GS95_9RHOB|nr:N-acetylmuramoyl-L-alanine amidase [Psychromarinibacter halotolerans]MDF0597232.1 N-acetylmuramoyl-L-alanine amidase [Psychromarinibacter halotolerans]
MVVIHFTAMTSCDAARDRLCDPEFEVSAHYLIGNDGTVLRLVDEAQRAWHAGAGRWGDVTDVNSRSIGIELDNTGAHPFSEPQMQALETLLRGILGRWSIPPERVIGHSDMALARKSDPGPRFDWRRLALGGLSVWPSHNAASAAEADFAEAATRFGYAPDLPPEMRLAAFRLRFRPWASGPLAPEDASAMADLARRFPVDGGPCAA